MKTVIPAATLCAAMLLSTACRQSTPASQSAAPAGASASAWAPTVEPLTLPTTSGSTAPQLTRSNKGVILSWIDQRDALASLNFIERTGDTWSAPRQVASGKDWFVSWADVPTVMRMADDTLVANWYRSTDVRSEAYDLWMSHSQDEGRTWARPFTPHHDGTRTQHGFASLFETPTGLGVVWLDAREWVLAKDDPEGGSVMLRYAAFNPSWKQTADETVNLRVCDCCQTTVAVTPDGVVTAFRDRTDKEIRDINVTRLVDGKWSEPQPVHQDNWMIDSCPVNGPALSAHGRVLVAAWFTAPNNDGHAYAAFSPDAGRTWGTPIRLDDDHSLGHVDVETLDDGSAVATWVEFTGQRSRFRMRHIDSTGAKSPAIDILGSGTGRVSGYPRMVRDGKDLVFAWTESAGASDGEGAQQVKGARARLP